MSELVLQGVSKRFGRDVTAVEEVSLTFKRGELTALLGPSGCGKTTLLRIIAGLEMPTTGSVYLGGDDISATTACERRFGMVFQSFALFPHLNVEDNIAYSLSINGIARQQRHKRAAELLALVKLDGYGKRRIGELSGGQRQRVAIARALAQDPSVFLLDEPMSALDAQLRESMQIELRLLQKELGITTIVVTHDQREAMTMADKIVVMSQGRVEQIGSPQEVYSNPASRFVASFIGTSNFLEGVVQSDHVSINGNALYMDGPIPYVKGARVCLCSRPEASLLVQANSSDAPRPNSLAARVKLVRSIGPVCEVFLDIDGTQILSVISSSTASIPAVGDQVYVEFPSDSLVLYPVDQHA